jgi:photosystem II stability/assembly factor-like uncharacterized protein
MLQKLTLFALLCGFTSCLVQGQQPSGFTPAGIPYTVLRKGAGARAEQGQDVWIYESMHYPSGKALFAVAPPAAPIRFQIGGNQVIAGVDDGVRGMQLGEIRQLTVPPSMSQRTQYPDFLSPDSSIVYTLELVSIGVPPVSEMVSAKSGNPASATGIVYQSDDAGENWTDISAGLAPELRLEYIATHSGVLWVGAENGGANSLQQGKWQKNGAPKPFPNDKITGIFPYGNDLYVSVFRGGFYRQRQPGGAWAPMHGTLPDHAVRAVLPLEKTLLTGTDGGIYQSANDGETWKQVFSHGQVTQLVAHKDVLYAGAFNGIWRSTDQAKTWTHVLQHGGTHKMKVIEGSLWVIDLSGQMRRTDDGGNTWRRTDEGLTPAHGIFDIEQVQKYLICSTGDGLYRSGDGGTTWQLTRALPTELMMDLTVEKGRLYAAAIRR